MHGCISSLPPFIKCLMYADFKCYQQSYAVFVLAVICVCVSVCVYLSIYLSIYIYIYISISLSIYICMCVCVCIYIHKKRNLLDAQIENCHPSRPQHFVLIGCSPLPFSLTFPVVVWSTWRVHAILVNTRAYDRATCCRLRSWVCSCYVGLRCLYRWDG